MSILVTLAALFSLLSVRVLRLPASVGTMSLASLSALGLAAAGRQVPGLHAFAVRLFEQVNFHDLVLHGMLAFLLFAGALHLDLDEMKRQRLAILVLATLGTILSAGLTGGLLWSILAVAHLRLPLALCLLFGALISPTDPIAVLDMLRRVGAPPFLHALLGSESLFNDGVGAVLFFALLDWKSAAGSSSGQAALTAVGMHFVVQACGGLLLGAALGYVTYWLLCVIDKPSVEILLTLSLAMGGYALADALHLSAPLEVVAAGLVANSHGRLRAMSERTIQELDAFWSLLDEMLNVILFLLLGFALVLVPISGRLLVSGLVAVVAVLVGRGLSVLLLGVVPGRDRSLPFRAQWMVLSWGGLRGALSVALVLALVGRPGAETLLAITYVVVSFAVVVQGLTMIPLLRRLGLTTGTDVGTVAS